VAAQLVASRVVLSSTELVSVMSFLMTRTFKNGYALSDSISMVNRISGLQ
jgi:hypothetical protein